MTRVRRNDVTKLDAGKRTPEGYIDTFGNLSKTGVLEYRREDGTIQRELRLPEHVFTQAAMSSCNGQPLTLVHPSKLVDSKSFKKDVVGVVIEPHKAEDGVHLRARVRVMDESAVIAVERGMRELSYGYETTLVPIPGGVFKRDDYNSGVEVHADYLQTEISNNHTALVPCGRAGPTVRLDSAGHQGVESTMNEEEKKAYDAAIAAAAAEKTRADAAEGRALAYEAQQAKITDASKAQAKQALAARVAPIVKKDAAEIAKLGDADVMRAALAVMQPTLKTDAWSEAMLAGAFEAAMLTEATRTDAATQMARAVGDIRQTADGLTEDENASETAFRKSRSDAAKHWQQKPAQK